MTAPLYAIDRDRWAQLDILQQMGNIASEVGRTFAAKVRGDQVGYELALGRALDLFEASAETALATRPHRVKEILRAKDQFLQALSEEQPDSPTTRSLEKYFMSFAVAARVRASAR